MNTVPAWTFYTCRQWPVSVYSRFRCIDPDGVPAYNTWILVMN